jgi:uncharacterized protein
MKSYDYKSREGVKEISWNTFHVMTKSLVEKINERNIDIIIGIAKAGLFPAALIAGMLRR